MKARFIATISAIIAISAQSIAADEYKSQFDFKDPFDEPEQQTQAPDNRTLRQNFSGKQNYYRCLLRNIGKARTDDAVDVIEDACKRLNHQPMRWYERWTE